MVLAKLGANLSHRNNKGKTAYMIAAASNRVRMMQALEEAGSPIDAPEELEGLARIQAMFNGNKINGSFSVGADRFDNSEVELDGDRLLMACLTGDTMTVSRQVAAGTDINYMNDEGRTALALAIQGLMQGEVSRRRERDFEQILDALLVAGADPKVGEFPYLVFAAMGRRRHLVNALIRAGASIDRTIGEGQTALFMSLLAPDAGRTVDDRCALALLNAGADSSLRHESGAMPIHLAAASNYLAALQALLDRRPQDVDAKTNIGITPLMMAATEGHAEAVSLLLKFGADRSLKDDEGLTAKDVAIKNGNDNLIPLLG
jgi:ankyrin repeat protein